MLKNKSGLSLVELMVSAAILAFCLCSLLASYIGSLALGNTARNYTLAVNAAQDRIEELRNSGYDNVHEGTAVSVPVGFTNSTGMMRTDVYSLATVNNFVNITYGDLKSIRVVVCWKDKGNRFIGEDNGRGSGIALNGILDGTEDVNSNGLLDSAVEVYTFISKGQ